VDVDIVEGDLADPDAVHEATKGIKTIYHAGAALNNNWEDNYQSTIKGTEYVIKAALRNEVERVLHVSTIAVYDLLAVTKEAKITESSPYPKNPKQMGAYAYAKIKAEKLILNAYKNEGLRATIVRPGMVIGPGGSVFFPHLGYRYQDRLFIVIGAGDRILPLTYVENTVDGIYRASIEENAIGQIYNVIDDGEISVRDYLNKFIEISGCEATILALPYIVAHTATTAYEIAALAGALKKGATSRRQLKAKQARVKFDNSKAKSDLGWEPIVSMEQGLAGTFKWYGNEFLKA
jgi:nucleoside-diphosphate-sugar epimerase